MRVAFHLNLKRLILIAITGALFWWMWPLFTPEPTTARGPLVAFGVWMFYLGSLLNGAFNKRVWKHYWLAEGYSSEAAAKEVAQLEQRVKDWVRSGAFFKN